MTPKRSAGSLSAKYYFIRSGRKAKKFQTDEEYIRYFYMYNDEANKKDRVVDQKSNTLWSEKQAN